MPTPIRTQPLYKRSWARAIRSFLLFTLALLLTIAVTFGTGVRPAAAAERLTVCATDVWVRYSPAGRPNSGQPKAVLYRGEHFDRYRTTSNGTWSYGFAYGGENEWGWILSSALGATCK